MKRILVVEDEPAIALGLEDDLRMEGYQGGAGWFIPKGLKDAGYSAEIQHQGCRQNSTCATVIGSATPKDQMFGNLMQSFNATAYRGKTVRLRAFLKMDSTNPDDATQIWLRVDRPNRTMGAFDNMGDRPVKSVNWSSAEIVAKVADDALTLNIGVMANPSEVFDLKPTSVDLRDSVEFRLWRAFLTS
jgi:hypothetical protein